MIELGLHVPHTREHAEQLAQRPHLLDRLHLLEEVLESEVLALGDFGGHALGLLGIKGALGLLDERHDIAHVEDARRHTVGVEGFEVLELLPRRGKQDRSTGHVDDGQGRATARVTVELGKDDAIKTNAGPKLLRRAYGVLPDHRVNDEENFVRLNGVPNLTQLLHEFAVDGESSRGIDDHDVVEVDFRVLDRIARNSHRVANAIARLGGEDRHTGALTHDPKLINRVGSLQVGGDEERLVRLLA